MTTIIDPTTHAASLFKLAWVKNPAQKIAVMEEQATHQPGEAYDPTVNVINDGRYAPNAAQTGDAPTIHHQKKCDVGSPMATSSPLRPPLPEASPTARPICSQSFRNQSNQLLTKP